LDRLDDGAEGTIGTIAFPDHNAGIMTRFACQILLMGSAYLKRLMSLMVDKN